MKIKFILCLFLMFLLGLLAGVLAFPQTCDKTDGHLWTALDPLSQEALVLGIFIGRGSAGYYLYTQGKDATFLEDSSLNVEQVYLEINVFYLRSQKLDYPIMFVFMTRDTWLEMTSEQARALPSWPGWHEIFAWIRKENEKPWIYH